MTNLTIADARVAEGVGGEDTPECVDAKLRLKRGMFREGAVEVSFWKEKHKKTFKYGRSS